MISLSEEIIATKVKIVNVIASVKEYKNTFASCVQTYLYSEIEKRAN